MQTNIIDLNKKHPDFNSIRWVMACMSKPKTEKGDHIRYLFVENNTFTATDGNRIHHFKSENQYISGFYEPVLSNKQRLFLVNRGNDKKYPEYQDILVRHGTTPFVVMDSQQTITQIIRGLKAGSINFKFLQDLFSFGDIFDCYVKDEYHPIYFSCGQKEAVIMAILDMGDE